MLSSQFDPICSSHVPNFRFSFHIFQCKTIWEVSMRSLKVLTDSLIFSSSFSFFCWICRCNTAFSSDILVLLARTSDCIRANVCMHFSVVVAWRLTDWRPISVFSRTRPLNALNALLACNKKEVLKRNCAQESNYLIPDNGYLTIIQTGVYLNTTSRARGSQRSWNFLCKWLLLKNL